MSMPLMRPARKNPILRTPQMNLPPSARSRVALGLTAAAAEGRFELQVCQDCDSVQYPPREACVHCVSPRLKWRAQSGGGQLLASTTLHQHAVAMAAQLAHACWGHTDTIFMVFDFCGQAD